MKRTLIALSILSVTAFAAAARAQSTTPAQSDSARFSEFVYDVLGATPSIQFGKSKAKMQPAPQTSTPAETANNAKAQPAAQTVRISEARSGAEHARPQP